MGTWTIDYGHARDSITIAQNGTFRQIYESPIGTIRYESDWNHWWLEERESGFVRLHLVGMKRTGELGSIFNRPLGGVDPIEFTMVDICEGGEVAMPSEVILVVTGADFPTPRGLLLRQMHLLGSEWDWYFSLDD